MKLTELNPRWVGMYNSPPDAKMGISFICPHCKDTNRRLAIFFANPICGNPPADVRSLHESQALDNHLADHHIGSQLWQRTGDTFENLTLSPSIDASQFGHWHGFIRNGEAV